MGAGMRTVSQVLEFKASSVRIQGVALDVKV